VPAEPSASSILDAIAAGHVRLSAGPEGPHLDLQAGARYVAKIGDSIQVPEAGRLRVRARCAGGKGGALRLLDEHGALLDTVLQSDEESVESELDVGRSLYVRAELRGDRESLLALTNPIYLRPGQL
jgi:hypothetical protein